MAGKKGVTTNASIILAIAIISGSIIVSAGVWAAYPGPVTSTIVTTFTTQTINIVSIYTTQTTQTTFSTLTQTDSITTETVSVVASNSTTRIIANGCGSLIELSGTEYCSLDITDNIALGDPGYSYFTNQISSITFMGVTFVAWCPSNYSGCPSQSDSNMTSTVVITLGAIKLALTFPDNLSETIGSVLGGDITILSQHTNPRAGIVIEYLKSSSGTTYIDSFLVVQDLTNGTISVPITTITTNSTFS